MTRRWAPSMKLMQDRIVALIQAEKDAQGSSLPSYLQTDGLAVLAGIGKPIETLAAHHIRVLPPENSRLDAEVTDGLEGTLEFPCILTVKTLSNQDATEALREVVGLVIDGVATDPTLAGACAGPASPNYILGPIVLSAGQATQEVAVRLVARNAS